MGVMMARHETDASGHARAVFHFVNPTFERITGYSQGEVLGQTWQFFQGKNTSEAAVRALDAAVRAGESHEETLLHYRKDGTPFWNALQLSPIHDRNGVLTEWIGLICDVSVRFEAENALRQSRENLTRAQELTHLGSWIFDLTESPAPRLFWSDEVFQILGLKPGSVAPSRALYFSLIHPDDRAQAIRLDESIATGRDFDAQYRVLRPGGEERTVQVHAVIERAANGAPRRAMGTIWDITERASAEKQAREAMGHLQMVLQNAPVMIWALDGAGQVNFVEGQAVNLLADHAQNHRGRSIFEIHPDNEAVHELAQRALAGENSSGFVEVNGHCFDVKYRALRDENGVSTGAVGIAIDISEHRRIARALSDSQTQLQVIIDALPMLIWAIDTQGIYTLSQGRALDLLRLGQGEVVGRSLFELYGDDSFAAAVARRALGGENGQEIFEVEGRFFESNFGPSRDETGQIIGAGGLSYDVTERERAKRELEASEARFGRIVANAPGMVYRFRRDTQGQYSFGFVSDGCREIYGLDAAYIMAHPQVLVDVVHPDDLAAFHVSILDSERDLSPWNWENRITRPDGAMRWVRCESRPERQEDGSTVWDGLIMDVTQTRLAQDEVLRSRRALDEAQKLAHIGSFEWNLESGEIHWSDEMFRIFGLQRESFQPTVQALFQLIAPSQREIVRGRAVQAVRTANPESMVIPITRADGEIRWLQTHSRAESNDQGRSIYIVGSAQDITEALEASRALRESEQRYALAAQGANDGLWDWNLETNQIYFSPRWKMMLGYAVDEIGDQPTEWMGRVHPDDLERLSGALAAHLSGESQHFECEYRLRCADQTYRWMLCRALAVFQQQSDANRDSPTASHLALRIAGSQTDITERKVAEVQLSRNAFYDKLTDLPNRALFLDRLERALARARRNSDYAFATLFLDIDRFKKINDTLGHMAGDQLLIEAAARFASCLRPGDTVARLGGDEFALLVDDIHDGGDVPLVAGRIQKELERPFLLEGKEIYVTVSIGMAPYRGGEATPDDLLRNADSAMYRAKALGRARSEVFDAATHQRAVQLLELESDLWRAIERGELCLHYQPIIALENNQICGYEALVRWNHPTRGLISPGEFIPLAEENGFILILGWWVLEEACRQAQQWNAARAVRFPEQRPHFISVNLSSKQFSQPDLIEHVRQIIARTGMDARFLTLEITESVIMEHTESANAALRGLRTMGIHLSMDDFGTGYSSLSYLHRFSLQTLKIDRSFISQMRPGAHQGEIVNTIVALANGLKMKVVAEGVETAEQLARLRDMGCGFGQGFLFSQPVSSEKIEALWESTPQLEANFLSDAG